ncbi:MAG: glycosyltransferase family 1 protein [Deltaproteobacteria bacterium]|nr:glycosyltransferase family 1 protein [Deltaproteobacteria bacterium]
MKIVINALSAYEGGAFNYLSQILKNLPQPSSHQIKVFVRPSNVPLLSSLPNVEPVAVPWGSKSLFHRILWERFYLSFFLYRWKADLVLNPGCTLNCFIPKNCRAAVVFQNLLPFDDRERRQYRWSRMGLRLFLLRQVMSKSLKKADLIIFPALYVKDALTGLIPSIAPKTMVINYGLTDNFKIAQNNTIPKPPNLTSPYILYVSTFFHYKAQLEVIEAYSLLKKMRETPEKLVMAGSGDPNYIQMVHEKIIKLGLEKDITHIPHVPHNKLPHYYKHAKVNLFASRCECLSFSYLEMLGAGRPIVASNRASMPRAGGDAPLYFDPDNPKELAILLRRVLDDDTLRESMASKAKDRAELFQWNRAGAKTWRTLEGLVKGPLLNNTSELLEVA